MDLLNEYKNIIFTVQDLLNKNHDDWTEKYCIRYEKIINNEEIITKAQKKFREWKPLYLYSNISKTMESNANNIVFSLRFEGQNVAELKIKDEKIILSENNTIYDNFEFTKKDVTEYEWRSSEAKYFRSFFKNRYENEIERINKNKSNNEHKFESLLLTEFSKHKSEFKAITGIQPIRLFGSRFQMTTPLNASKAKDDIISYVNKGAGGGVDILARFNKGKNSELCIMELKDECESTEKPEKAIKQAITYATFIRELLRNSDANNSGWWKLFGYKEIKDKLTLKAVIVMPMGDYNDRSLITHKLLLGGNDELELHYIYFDKTTLNNKIDYTKPVIETSLIN